MSGRGCPRCRAMGRTKCGCESLAPPHSCRGCGNVIPADVEWCGGCTEDREHYFKLHVGTDGVDTLGSKDA